MFNQNDIIGIFYRLDYDLRVLTLQATLKPDEWDGVYCGISPRTFDTVFCGEGNYDDRYCFYTLSRTLPFGVLEIKASQLFISRGRLIFIVWLLRQSYRQNIVFFSELLGNKVCGLRKPMTSKVGDFDPYFHVYTHEQTVEVLTFFRVVYNEIYVELLAWGQS